MKTQKTIKSLNAAKIIAAKNAETNGDDFVSNVGGEEIIWNFRKTEDFGRACVCDEQDADCIVILNAGTVANRDYGFGEPLVRIAI